MIPQRNISLLSNRLAAGGARRMREDVLERDYCLAWFLAALAESDLSAALAFKGGTALKRCYFGDYRFSEDLDFTLLKPMTSDEVLSHLGRVYPLLRERSGVVFTFDREDRHQHSNSYTFYLRYVGPLPGGGDVKVDITLREHLAYPLERRNVLRGYPEFADIPADRPLSVYSLQEIAAEKVLALADQARNEPRDLYDLWYLTSNEGIDIGSLTDAVHDKLGFRGLSFQGIADAIARKEGRLKRLWTSRLGNQMAKLPPFDEVFRVMRRHFRHADWP
jgi:predicted nucleotidyltransferase component of viral defense system